ncbi:hypothetical protein [Rhizobium lusitanum]|uniref:Uncharacterized protein n=1 Tax=Rhizobium lusitanum TaxID=293958 RepID=A0A7X0MFS2_9HYPH|nr:hypothetical protein [Rhizobium lusitanum]MBB6488766.1 hypothetical protein [Rhizobium lusitanum]
MEYAWMMAEETVAAIALGAAVLTRIKDPAMREVAIRNALTAASSCPHQGIRSAILPLDAETWKERDDPVTRPRYSMRRMRQEITKAEERGRLAERERCAKIAEGDARDFDFQRALADGDDISHGMASAQLEIARRIRENGDGK